MIRQHYTSNSAEAQLKRPEVLAAIQFNRDCRPSGIPGLIPVGLQSLNLHQCELIESTRGTVSRGIDGNCYWSTNGEQLFTAVWISEEDCAHIDQGAAKAYSELLSQTKKMGYPHPFRVWNFIPNINVGPGDREEYKKFCSGRLAAYQQSGIAAESFPAASALGHHGSGAVIYALSSKATGIHYENPRQQSAYRYPREYGPSSPSFARATGVKLGQERWVFISGTASILGHETQAPESLQAQLSTTIENIRILCDSISPKRQALSALRVYLRHKADLDTTKTCIAKCYPDIEVNYLFADICRANLLVEIEAAFALSY